MTAPDLVVIFARPVRWEDTSAAVQSRRMLWDAEHNGSVLVASSKRPFEDGALALLDAGVPSDTIVTFRNAGSATDVFLPMRLVDAAKPAAKRREQLARLVQRAA